MPSISRSRSIDTSRSAATIRAPISAAIACRSSRVDGLAPIFFLSAWTSRSACALNPRGSVTHRDPSASRSVRRACISPSSAARRGATPGRSVAAARRWQATVGGVGGSLARAEYMSRTTAAIREAASCSSLGSVSRWCATASGVVVSRRAPVMKKSCGGTCNQAQSRRNVARSGWAPVSTRDHVMKLTPAASAACRIDNSVDIRRSRSRSASSLTFNCAISEAPADF